MIVLATLIFLIATGQMQLNWGWLIVATAFDLWIASIIGGK